MAQILVKTPVTSNGRDPIMDATGRQVYKETVLMAAARPVIEKQNAKLPTHLKKIVTDWPENPAPSKPTTKPKADDSK